MLHQIGGQVGTAMVERGLDGVENLLQRVVQGLADFFAGDRGPSGQTADGVQAADLGDQFLFQAGRRCRCRSAGARRRADRSAGCSGGGDNRRWPGPCGRRRCGCDWAATTSPRLSTATSVVPPPMSQTMLASGSAMGRPAPMAAALASGMTHTCRRPARWTLLKTARFSTGVMRPGTPTSTRGFSRQPGGWALRRK